MGIGIYNTLPHAIASQKAGRLRPYSGFSLRLAAGTLKIRNRIPAQKFAGKNLGQKGKKTFFFPIGKSDGTRERDRLIVLYYMYYKLYM